MSLRSVPRGLFGHRIPQHLSYFFRHEFLAVCSERGCDNQVRADSIDLESLDEPILLSALYAPNAVSFHRIFDEFQHCRSEIDAGVAVPRSLSLSFHN